VFDRQQLLTMTTGIHQDVPGARHVRSGQQQPQHVHGLLPLDLIGSAAGRLQPLELVVGVPVIGLGHPAGQKCAPQTQQLVTSRAGVLDDR